MTYRDKICLDISTIVELMWCPYKRTLQEDEKLSDRVAVNSEGGFTFWLCWQFSFADNVSIIWRK